MTSAVCANDPQYEGFSEDSPMCPRIAGIRLGNDFTFNGRLTEAIELVEGLDTSSPGAALVAAEVRLADGRLRRRRH